MRGIDLGNIPVAGHLTVKPSPQAPRVVTHMEVCSNCGLGQLSLDLDPSDLYVNYNWRTSTSKSYLDYIYDFADKNIIPATEKNDWVLEIASNDGYLLNYLIHEGVDVLGVDPSKNISLYAIASGVPVITDFFSLEVAKAIVELKGYPKWIVANNVLAHTPNIKSFVQGILILCGEETTVTIENPTILNILQHNQFETIFHEHYSYLGANSVKHLANECDLRLFRIDKVSPQGGSNRYWLTKSLLPIEDSVDAVINEEIEAGLFSQEAWTIANAKTRDSIFRFGKNIKDLVDNGARVAAYAASAKSSTVINVAGLSSREILAIADDVVEKQGTYIPGTEIPVITREKLLELSPTHVIIFAHNIKEELLRNLRESGYSGEVLVWSDL